MSDALAALNDALARVDHADEVAGDAEDAHIEQDDAMGLVIIHAAEHGDPLAIRYLEWEKARKPHTRWYA